jgi:phenylalanyl-tRNA synthetase beta chain
MKVPLKWLEEFVSIDIPVAELADRLTFAGLEVGEVIEVGADWDREKVFVGEIVGVRQHPDADRLTLVTVNYGSDEPLEMVTGAPNITVGMSGEKVPVALVGARLRNPKAGEGETIVLKPAKIRGVKSEGMVCSESELGLSDDHEGIMFLPDEAVVGTPLRDYLGDTVLDLELTPNLSYCLSLEGVARELHALGAGKLRERVFDFVEEGGDVGGMIEIEIADPGRCPRYTAAVVEGVSVGPSPFWMQHRLKLAGLRPINSIVDITNYVMWETGQPLHAFDYDLLKGEKDGEPPKIVVRTAKEGEKITTLDGAERTCGDEDLLICDGQVPVAVAGVMGGQETEVNDKTTNVLIESAGFDRTSVRRTAASLRLPSEASMRFGRGISPEGSPLAARQAADLMRWYCGGTVAKGIADAYPRPQETVTLSIDNHEAERILGVHVKLEDMKNIFDDLGFGVEEKDGRLRVEAPWYRLDIGIPADLVEEVARITGYDRIPSAPLPGGFEPPSPSPRQEAEDRIRDTLVDCGLQEVITYSLTDPALSVKLGLEESDAGFMKLANPLSADRTHMRRHLAPSLLETLQTNLRYVNRVAIFEVARVFLPGNKPLPEEPRRLGVLLSGPEAEPSWNNAEPADFEFFHLKGMVQALAERMGLTDIIFEPVEQAPYQAGRAALVKVGDVPLGTFGELDPSLREVFDLPERRVVLGEFDVPGLVAGVGDTSHRELSRFPVLSQDVSLVCAEEVTAAEMEKAIRAAAGPLLVNVRLFDVYRGDQIGAGRKSLAYALDFQATDRTLTEEEINAVRGKIVKKLKKQLDADLRS